MAEPAARVGDDIAHSHAGMGLITGLVLGGVVAGAILFTGGLALVPLAGAATALSVGGLSGGYIGGGSMGDPCGKFVTGSPNVFINGRPATMTAFSFAACAKESGGPVPLATGAVTVMINAGLAGREGEKLGCSAVSVKQTSPDVFIGGPSAADPRVTITPEIPTWATTALTVLGIAGAVMMLPAAIASVGVATTLAVTAGGFVGAGLGAKGGRALGEALGLPEAGIRTLEVGGGLLGGMVGGRAGLKGIQTSRRATAQAFYEQQGMPVKDIPDHLKGIDFNRPVEVVPLDKGVSVDQMQVPGGRQGSYYSPPGTPATKLGINPQGTDYATGAVVDKAPTTYTTTKQVPVLRSTAAPIKDTWSVKGQDYQTEGGGTQYFSIDKGAFGP